MIFIVFPQHPKPAPSTIMRCLKWFTNTGSVNYERKGRSSPNRIETATDTVVLAAVEANPASSSQQIGQPIGKLHSQVIRTLHKHGYRSYKTSVYQELRLGNAERRLDFAMAALEIINYKLCSALHSKHHFHR